MFKKFNTTDVFGRVRSRVRSPRGQSGSLTRRGRKLPKQPDGFTNYTLVAVTENNHVRHPDRHVHGHPKCVLSGCVCGRACIIVYIALFKPAFLAFFYFKRVFKFLKITPLPYVKKIDSFFFFNYADPIKCKIVYILISLLWTLDYSFKIKKHFQ